MKALVPYIKIARPDNWFKNVFMLPGVVIVLFGDLSLLSVTLLVNVAVAFVALCLIASSYYVLNEILDAEQDALHPVKKNRPIPSGQVNIAFAYTEWLVLAAIGLAIAWQLGDKFFLTALILWCISLVYNIRPLRSKDKPYLDVLTESFNNPLRLMMGWYATGVAAPIPVSLIIAYWMVGAFFMAVKRLAEYRRIDNPELAAAYRASFKYYNEERLLVSIIFYSAAFGLFFGAFMIRYHIELFLSIPFIAGFISWYIHLGFKQDSPTQYPEQLYKQRGFILYTMLCVVVMIGLLFVNIEAFDEIFSPTKLLLPNVN